MQTLAETNFTQLLIDLLAVGIGIGGYVTNERLERNRGFNDDQPLALPQHTGRRLIADVLDFGKSVGFGAGSQPSIPSSTANGGWQNTVDGLVKYVFNYDPAQDILLNPDGTPIGMRGSRDDIRELLGGFDAAREMFDALTQGGSVDAGSNYPGIWVNRPNNGGAVGLRDYAAKSLGTEATLDVNIPGIPIKKLKFNP